MGGLPTSDIEPPSTGIFSLLSSVLCSETLQFSVRNAFLSRLQNRARPGDVFGDLGFEGGGVGEGVSLRSQTMSETQSFWP